MFALVLKCFHKLFLKVLLKKFYCYEEYEDKKGTKNCTWQYLISSRYSCKRNNRLMEVVYFDAQSDFN